MASRRLDVHLEHAGVTSLLGHAWFEQRRNGPVTTVFSYATSHLASSTTPFNVDPNLQLVTGNQYVSRLPGAFADAAPDRWGRNLIDKRHRLEMPASRAGDLNDVDYLTGVSDLTRQGALRFTDHDDATFVHPDTNVPKLIDLPKLLRASDQIADDSDDLAAVQTLLEAGSGSLGGARPKASVLAPTGELLLAKFPHPADAWDVMAWECVALDLAELAGVDTPERQLVKVSGNRNVLLLQRFDRTSAGHRVAYISAMTALEAVDGEWHDYTEIAERLTDISARPVADLAQLYRRVALNVALRNTDDHLRNHGFLAARGGWAMSPVFDVNPTPNAQASRVTGIAGATHPDEEPEGLRVLAEHCRLTLDEAADVRSQVNEAVATWRDIARARGMSRHEIAEFDDVFTPLPSTSAP